MAITDQNTVLVLGAGVSVPFGLPLGGQLIEQIAKSLANEHSIIFKDDDRYINHSQSRLMSAVYDPKQFQSTPIYGTALLEYYDPYFSRLTDEAQNEIDKLYTFSQLLSNQTSETIDDFIVENPDYSRLAKIAIASVFMKLCYFFNDNNTEPKAFHTREYPKNTNNQSNRNWVHLLINIVRQGIRTEFVNQNNKVKIITFNYDMILEYILDKQFSNTQAGYNNWRDYIEIIHVHGQCGSLTKYTDLPQRTCLKWAEGIHVVNETNVPEHIEQARDMAHDLISTAKELYFCGFSFAGPNCRLLGLDKLIANHKSALISVCNYDGNVGISRILQSIEKNSKAKITISSPDEPAGRIRLAKTFDTCFSVDEAKGEFDRPMTVVDWLRLGYLGELPG